MISKKNIYVFSTIFFSFNLQGCARLFKKDNSRPQLSEYSSQFNSVVIFGDSLSDTGNVDLLSRATKDIPGSGVSKAYPVSPPYKEGRFSNGKIWVDKLLKDLKLSPPSAHDCFFNINTNRACNFAVGGSTTSNNKNLENDFFKRINDLFKNEVITNYLKSFQVFMNIGVKEMIKEYVTVNKPDEYALNHTLYVIWVGGNDYLQKSDPTLTVNNIIESIKIILDYSSSNDKKYFLIPNLPNLGKTPYAMKRKEEIETLAHVTAKHNSILNEKLEILKNQLEYKDKLVIINLKIDNFFKKITSFPTFYGFKKVNEACYSKNYLENDGEICSTPDKYLFWDEIHPSKRAHCLIANFAEKAIIDAGLIKNLHPDNNECDIIQDS
ncbi:SGNH/GDSL hydrolase family protein [Pigmentibacter sp. JX0631]|uniref:SGNH/GDSL hydrolase family protein n=1 Tax=Pigmentibacter sp. JX0631 TaxID=2976982 RepID=UPI002468A66C|nr:SGNH/GDSL hydrolase family protein [Pigmentibacter sp. JX0631]WGL59771.1 SGNH/GDSL hydrolase family protein [Pigmentibacter sp. JX0631]